MYSNFDRTIHVTGSSPKEFGRYYIKGTDALYIGHTKHGWWYWQFRLDEEDVNKPNEWFDMLMEIGKYETKGYSSAYFNSLADLNKELNG